MLITNLRLRVTREESVNLSNLKVLLCVVSYIQVRMGEVLFCKRL